ncbi:hypothetical protein AJ85_01020 [Alkalihalobacillus alcalophilus ATCC 27647 = CGMCC 1.3604]|uniref:Glyoxalase n=1 Tax=Alkalihalobacillus alcalophilus ATCC 27647 = CGMCC 1.3604 TaxID=1218173 RepID=A0A094WFE7_ALKAL|nr:hypothetical protein BALCAV_0215980 [Alkalihalobacillus alcalophilus ATCC 27647 = CGMCC 1.3604]THG88684.1 hypothetical protein AJ85_01020 [Alkalihalobacillus alcalophilus ATCC 27647 = CGMCC 1.3604]
MSVIPVLRMYDLEKTKDFYLNYIGMRQDWEHQYEETLPIYIQVSLGDVVLHLSEHFGDGAPGSVIRVGLKDLHGWYEEISKKTIDMQGLVWRMDLREKK